VISASDGAGHDGATPVLAAQLHRYGFPVTCLDLTDVFPWRLGRLLRGTYRGLLTRLPWLYDWLLAIACRFTGAAPVTRALLSPIRPRMRRSLPAGTAAVVSTYPIASRLLGPLRRSGRLPVPVITYLPDFAVHPIWVSPGVDVYCAAHDISSTMSAAVPNWTPPWLTAMRAEPAKATRLPTQRRAVGALAARCSGEQDAVDGRRCRREQLRLAGWRGLDRSAAAGARLAGE